MDEVPVLRTSVLGDVSEIAVVKPVVLGGQTEAGYASLKRLVETVTLSKLLRSTTAAVESVRMRVR
jgi:type IV secretory pathway VirB2 component (pilin)